MSENEGLSIRGVLNPMDFEHPALVGVAAGGAAIFAAGMFISDHLHRETHGGVKYSERAQKLMRVGNFLYTGMSLRDWVDHLCHHEFPDQYNEEAHNEWNLGRPKGAPEAPQAIFRDPYSVELEGYPKVLFDTAGLHRVAKVPSLKFLTELIEYDRANGQTTRDHWPKHLQRISIEDFDPDLLRNKRPYAGLIMRGTAETAVLGPAPAAISVGTNVLGLLYAAGDINAWKHTGIEKGIINRIKVVLGIKKAVRNAKGELAANTAKKFGWLNGGEESHEDHHGNPSNPLISGDTLKSDPPGFVIRLLALTNDAELPGLPNYMPRKLLGKYSLSWLYNKKGVPPEKDYQAQLATWKSAKKSNQRVA